VHLQSPQGWLLGGREGPFPGVCIAKATKQIAAIEHCGEQANVFAAGRIEPGVSAPGDHPSLRNPFHLARGQRRVVED